MAGMSEVRLDFNDLVAAIDAKLEQAKTAG
jgi:hypothetical protein